MFENKNGWVVAHFNVIDNASCMQIISMIAVQLAAIGAYANHATMCVTADVICDPLYDRAVL